MSVAGRLAVLALRPLAEGACESVGQTAGETAPGPVADFLTQKFTEQGAAFAEALRKAMDRAWKAVEVALNGAAWLRQTAANADDRPLAEQLKPFVQQTEPEAARHEAQRRL